MPHLPRRAAWIALLIALALIILPAGPGHAQDAPAAALAYVLQDTVTLAGADGYPLEATGPTFAYGQGARLFWSADGRTLYIARDDGLYAAGSRGGAAVQMPGTYSRTLVISQDGAAIYYLESVSPQALNDPERVAYPIRELQVALMDGGAGRLAGYFGRFQAGAARADLTFAAALYARDGGLLGPSRPNLWPTYGSNLFGTCCFPDAGLGLFNLNSGEFSVYDEAFLPGPAAANLTRTHLAGPTTGGAIRVIDLITGGSRDYVVEIAGGLGTVERLAWSPDDTYLYFISRYDPDTPLALNAEPPFPVDTRSARIVLYRLNLVTSVVRELAWRPDVYGVSALAATADYVFAVVVDPNTALINALNAGQIPPGTLSTDPALAAYMPQTHLWRVDASGGAAQDIAENVWGVVARPRR